MLYLEDPSCLAGCGVCREQHALERLCSQSHPLGQTATLLEHAPAVLLSAPGLAPNGVSARLRGVPQCVRHICWCPQVIQGVLRVVGGWAQNLVRSSG